MGGGQAAWLTSTSGQLGLLVLEADIMKLMLEDGSACIQHTLSFPLSRLHAFTPFL